MWLAAYRDGGPRHRLGDNPGRDQGRTRVALPPAMFMRERLVGIGGEKFDKRVLHSLCGNQPAADAFDIFGHVIVGSKLKLTSPIIGLLKITSDECVSYEGPATKWHQESAVQMACYHHPLDAYDVRVLDVKPLDVPYYVDYRVSSTDGHGNLTKVSTTHPLFFAHWPLHDAGAIKLRRRLVFGSLGGDAQPHDCISASMLLRAWNIEGSPDHLPVLAVPLPIALLVVSGQWHYLTILARWHRNIIASGRPSLRRMVAGPQRFCGPIADWPAARASVWSNFGQHKKVCDAADEALAMTPETLEKMSESIRKLRAGENGPEVMRDTEQSLTVLDSWSTLLRGALGTADGMSGYPRRQKYESDTLLECIRLASLLTGRGSRLHEVVKRSLVLVAPAFLSKALADNLGQDCLGIIPHATLLQRHEFSLDAALQVFLRKRSLEKSVFRYGHADSSPIAGYDWLWTQHVEIPVAAVDKAFKAVLTLQQETETWYRTELADLEEGVMWWKDRVVPDSWKVAAKTIKDNLFEVIHPPGAHGSGHRGAVHKASRMVCGWKLGTDNREDLLHVATTFISHCSDMGVELGLPDLSCRNPNDLLPEWMRTVGLRQDDVVDIVADDEDTLSCDSFGEPKIARLGEPSNVAAAEVVEDAEQLAPTYKSYLADLAELHAAGVLLPACLTIPGLQHIANNMVAEVHTSMEHWGEFFSQCKALEAMLVIPERRSRYIWTCLRGTAHGHKDFALYNKVASHKNAK